MSPPEILVHAAAPSRTSDDARYRKEAVGILRFECIKRHHLLPHPALPGTNTAAFDPTSDAEPGQQILPQDSLTSTDPVPRHHLTNALTTWLTPTLTHPSPKLLVGRTPAPLQHDRISLRTGHVLINRTPIDHQRPWTAPSGPCTIQETPNLRRALPDSFETPPSIIPDSQSTPLSQHNRKRPLDESSSPSPTHQPNVKRSKPHPEEEFEEWTQPEDTSTPLLPNPAPSSSSTTPTPPISSSSPPPERKNTGPSYRRRQSFPPYPEPGNSPFSTHLTPILLRLQRDCTRFTQMVQPRRAIGVLERGHWRFSISAEVAWDHDAREKMWTFLRDCIESGRAGWGVWAVFEEEGGDDGTGDRVKTGQGRVKVYCWGEVVKEVFALLVLATDRKVKRCGAQWVDAGGVVVVDMGVGGSS